MATIETNDVDHWCRSFLADLNGSPPEIQAQGAAIKPATAEADRWGARGTSPAWTPTMGR